MKRSLMSAYVVGSDKAVPFYQKAFDAVLISSYLNEDGTYYHSELDIEGEILSVIEHCTNPQNVKIDNGVVTGNVMQFCLHYGEEDGNEEKLWKAYDVLKTNAQIFMPPTPSDYSPLTADLIDQYGIRWCLFI